MGLLPSFEILLNSSSESYNERVAFLKTRNLNGRQPRRRKNEGEKPQVKSILTDKHRGSQGVGKKPPKGLWLDGNGG